MTTGRAAQSRARVECDGVRVGCDVVRVDRMERLTRRYPAHFLHDAFTAAELEHCDSRELAAVFAIKEAVLKAVGIGVRLGVSLRDVQVELANRHAAQVQLHGALSAVGRAFQASAQIGGEDDLAWAVTLLVRKGDTCVIS